MTTFRSTIQFFVVVPALAAGGCASVPMARPSMAIEMYGEIHGTLEIPHYFETIARQRLRTSAPLAVGLEITGQDIATACQALRMRRPLGQGGRWLEARHDGRLSVAMARLTCDLSRMRGVVLFPLISDDASPARDQMISSAILEQTRQSRSVVALMGNLHARNSATSAAALVRATGRPVASYVFDARRPSQAWIDTGANGGAVTTVSARFCTTAQEIAVNGIMFKQTPGARWDNCISLEQFSASPPMARGGG